MKTHHPYAANITMENWLDLLAVQQIDGRSINSLINEGARLMVRKTKENLGQYRKDRETIRSVAAFRA
jgi:hypothetical protein